MITQKAKAGILLDKFWLPDVENGREVAKECAKLCVEEIKESLLDELPRKFTLSILLWWDGVIKELDNL